MPVSRASSRAPRKDLQALQAAGFDAVMFGNENDRPYELKADVASPRQWPMSSAGSAPRSRRPSASTSCGIRSQLSRVAAATGASFVREIFTGSMRPIWARGRPTQARRFAIASGSIAATLRSSTTSRPNSPIRSTVAASPTGRAARSSRSIPDAILVSGAITGEAARMEDLEEAKRALPETPVLANTGVKHATVRDVLARRRWLHRRIGAENRRRHLEASRSRSERANSCGSRAPRGRG